MFGLILCMKGLTHFMSPHQSLSIPPENRKSKFSDFFREYRKRPVLWNGLMTNEYF